MNKKLLLLLISLIFLSSLSSVNSLEKMSATPKDFFVLYGDDQPAAEMFSYSITIDGNVYYINNYTAKKLASFSPNFGKVYSQANGRLNSGIYDFDNDKAFDFEYMSGQQVGFNKDANVITKIYYPNSGEEII